MGSISWRVADLPTLLRTSLFSVSIKKGRVIELPLVAHVGAGDKGVRQARVKRKHTAYVQRGQGALLKGQTGLG